MRTEESAAHRRTLKFVSCVGLSMSTADVVAKARAVSDAREVVIYFPTHIASSLTLALSAEEFRNDAIDLVVM